MPKKRKHGESESKNQLYMIEVDDWEISYNFHINTPEIKLNFPEDYSEMPILVLQGRITWPEVKDVERVKIEIEGSAKLDESLGKENSENPPQSNGWMTLEKDKNTLSISCSVPARSIAFISVVATVGKMKRVSIWGTKLNRGFGFVSGIDLMTRPDEQWEAVTATGSSSDSQ